MIKITVKQLQNLKACQSGIDWFIKSKKKTLKAVISACLKDNHVDYARWLLKHLLTSKQNQLWAIYCAELVLNIFEKQYPTDDRPRKAIQAAKDFLAGKITASAVAYATDVAHAASAAVYATDVAYAASAASAAVYAASSVASADSAAASAVAYATDVASATSAAYIVPKLKINQKIMVYALKLLGEI